MWRCLVSVSASYCTGVHRHCESVQLCSNTSSGSKCVPHVLYRRVRGSLQQRFLFGSGEKLRPPAGHRRRGLQGEPVGCQQGQLHHGETADCDLNTTSTTVCLSEVHCLKGFQPRCILTVCDGLSEFDRSQDPSGVCADQCVRGSNRHWFSVWIDTSLGHGGCKE